MAAFYNEKTKNWELWASKPKGAYLDESEYAIKFPPPKPKEPTVTELLAQRTAEFIAVVDSAMNAKAKEKGYDNILTACSYTLADSPFFKESQAFQKWRDEVYTWGYGLIEKIKKGTMKLPSSFDEIAADMPTFKG